MTVVNLSRGSSISFQVSSPLGISVLRRTNGKLSRLPASGRVLPEEPIRIEGTTAITEAHLTLRIEDELGNEVLPKKGVSSVSGKGWIDTTAPLEEGKYYAIATAEHIYFWWTTREQSVSFIVSEEAPPPPKAPEGASLFDMLKDVKWIILGILGITVIGYLPKLKK